MKLQDLTDVAQANDEARLRRLLLKAMAGFDFEYLVAALFKDEQGIGRTCRIVHNLPAAYVAMAGGPNGPRRDPCFRQQLSKHFPAVYDQRTYLAHGASDLWECSAPFGLRTGLAVSLHLPRNRKFLLCMDRHRALPRDQELLARMLADAQLLAVYAHAAAGRLFEPEPIRDGHVPRLTPREIEVLRWVQAGKSSWDIGRILSTSDDTVNFHVKNSLRKLGACNRCDAVVKAMSLGIL